MAIIPWQATLQLQYCFRCTRQFDSWSSLCQHIEFSSRHHKCHTCGLDLDGKDALNHHLETFHCFCVPCNQPCFTPLQFLQHRAIAHAPPMHLLSYAPLTVGLASQLRDHEHTRADNDIIDCPGCRRIFPTESAMVAHLESGHCPSRVDLEWVVDTVSLCHEVYPYMAGGDAKFLCPGCAAAFTRFGSLLQHVESETESCAADLDPESPLGQVLRFMRSRCVPI